LAGGPDGTVTVTESGLLASDPSRTTRVKVTDVPAAGAVKVGFAAVAFERVTAGPVACVERG
jgi:hypothetical protein